jgi:phage baseplate assembly protein gpV
MRTGELYQRYYGHYMATVVDVNDPMKLGRVRLQSDQFADTMDQPIWASVSRPSAGNKTGVFFTPKKGDQVVISYVSGDVREPMIVGYSHSSQSAPDPSLVGPKKHGIVTSIGSAIFDEDGNTITLTLIGPPQQTLTFDKVKGTKLDFAGPPESSIVLDPTGITMQKMVTVLGTLAAGSISAGAGGPTPGAFNMSNPAPGGTMTLSLGQPPTQSVTLDPTAGIKLDFAGPPESSVVINGSGITLSFGTPPAATITLSAAGVAVTGLAFTFNGSPVLT